MLNLTLQRRQMLASIAVAPLHDAKTPAARNDLETPRLFGVETPRPRLEAVRVVDMSASNSWAAFASVYRRTRPAFQEHEGAKGDLKKLVPEDAKEAIGHGIRAKRSKTGAVSFELMDMEAADAQLQ